MKISLVLTTLNRADELKNFLLHYINQSYVNHELIIVDQSCDEIASVNQNNLKRIITANMNVNYVRCKTLGLSHGRNIGLKLVSGDVVGFPDDDCWYPTDFLEKAFNLFSRNKCDFISGFYREENLDNSNRPFYSHEITKGNMKVEGVNSVSLFVKFHQAIRFDESIGAGTKMPIGEEKDLVLQELKRGHIGIYDQDFYCFHIIERSSNLSNEQVLARYAAQTYIYKKHSWSLNYSMKLVKSIVSNLFRGRFLVVKVIISTLAIK
ncbi:glycosyltransferase family 2 protein [Vibrio breoganii]